MHIVADVIGIVVSVGAWAFPIYGFYVAFTDSRAKGRGFFRAMVWSFVVAGCAFFIWAILSVVVNIIAAGLGVPV